MPGFFAQLFNERRWNPNPSWWNLLALWILPVGCIVCFIASQNYRAIAHRERTTDAQIIAVATGNHRSSQYRFSFNGNTYTGWAFSPGYPKTEFELAQRVPVHFDPQNPRENSLDDYKLKADGTLELIPILVLVSLTVVAVIFFQRRSFRETERNKQMSAETIHSEFLFSSLAPRDQVFNLVQHLRLCYRIRSSCRLTGLLALAIRRRFHFWKASPIRPLHN